MQPSHMKIFDTEGERKKYYSLFGGLEGYFKGSVGSGI